MRLIAILREYLMRENRLKGLWADDHAALGGWLTIPSSLSAEYLAHAGLDWLCIDMQHGSIDYQVAVTMLQAISTTETVPIVRVPWNEPAAVMRALDTGASAVLVPMVNSGAEAARAAAACRFPPTGERSWGPMWGDTRPDGALPPAEQDAAAICLVMVETLAGVEALQEIVRTPGVDGVYIGPNDLTLGCGYGRATYRDSAEVDALIQRVVDACRTEGIVAGLHCSDPEMAVHWAGRGARLLTAGQDTSLLRAAAGQLWDAVAGRTGRGTAGSER